jgi:arylsulfatase
MLRVALRHGRLGPSRQYPALFRGVHDGRYKFARYFSPLHFNTPTDLESLYENNDVELYAMGTSECDNMAHPQGNNPGLVEDYNNKLNSIISKEIGVDDGRETSNFIDGIEKYGK